MISDDDDTVLEPTPLEPLSPRCDVCGAEVGDDGQTMVECVLCYPCCCNARG